MEEIFGSYNEIQPKLDRLKKQLNIFRVLILVAALLNVAAFIRYLFVDGYLEIIGNVNGAWKMLIPLLRIGLVWWSLKHPFRAFLCLSISWGYYALKNLVVWNDQILYGGVSILMDIIFLVFLVYATRKAWKYEQLKTQLYGGDI